MSHAENHCLRRHADYRISQRQIMTELNGPASAEDKIKKTTKTVLKMMQYSLILQVS